MKVFSFDVESNGLYGFAFAIAVTVRENGREVASFQGRIPDSFVTDEWVKQNILLPGALDDMPITHATSEELEEAFWMFWMLHRGDGRHPSIIPIAHCGHPVETGLFQRCVVRKLQERKFLPAFPLHELETILLAVGEYPIGAEDYAHKHGIAIPFAGVEHHPMFDAVVTAVVWEHACKRLSVK